MSDTILESEISEKIQKTENLIEKLKKIARKAIEKKQYNKALSSLSACANILYEYNQRYKDDEIEDMLLDIGPEIVSVPDAFRPKECKPVKTVLYYDGFGLDTRGLAINMTKVIASIGYKLIYVTNKNSMYSQPHIRQELENYDVDYLYINMSVSYVKWAVDLHEIFLKYAPEVAYFYSTPFDVSGALVFNQYEGRVTRFLVNLTDHAFWIGIHTFDYCTTSRAIGAGINLYERGIPVDKMIRNCGILYINEKIEMRPLPFDTNQSSYVFSGGALYKTLGDPNNLFYKIIEYIITKYHAVNFVYSGEGDTSEFDKLIRKYPGRVFLFHEREDFYQLIKGSVFYLNTYPMFGGLMTRYAAYAGKIPLTIRHDHDSDGLLPHQEELGIEFDSYEEILPEIDRLLSDIEYRKSKEKKLCIAVFTLEDSAENLKNIIENQQSKFKVEIEKFDTSKFRKEYLYRLDYRNLERNSIAKARNFRLIPYFPRLFIRKVVEKFFRR